MQPLLPVHDSSAADWRQRLLSAILQTALVVGVVPTALTVPRALDTGQWWHTVVATLVLAGVAVLLYGPLQPLRQRAWMTLALLFGIGVWLVATVGTLAQIYLLACPVIAALLLPRLHAMAMLGACTLTLIGVGWGLGVPLHLPDMDNRPLLKWLHVGANFAFIGGLITVSCTYMLRRLEASLMQQSSAADLLRASEEMLSQITAQVPGMVFRLRVSPDGVPHYIYVSPGVRTLFGLEPDELLADGQRLRRLWHPEDRAWVADEHRKARLASAPLSLEFRVLMSDGETRWIHMRSSAVSTDEWGWVRTGIMLDITDRKASEALVWRQANFDALTGLPNRSMQRDRLEQAIARSRRDHLPLALMLIDLDHFKEVNDTLGHDHGDLLLVEAARRIRHCVRETDVVARMGGDEFTVMLPALHDLRRVDMIAGAIITSLCEVFQLGSERAYVSASIGITLYPSDADQIDGLLKNADQALYVAKDGGRNRFAYFTPEMQELAQNRVRLANDLRMAIDEGQFMVHYQPIVELATGRVSKAEALIRWRHPERGMVPPDQFIPIAESGGLISEIGDWVLKTAAAQVLQWRRELDPAFQVSVNRSPAQFRTDGSGRPAWSEVLQGLEVPGNALVMEITEGLLLDASDGVTAQLLAFRDAGVAVALDDFGTGYSSLSYLRRFDIDFLKMDRSFVAAIDGDETGRPLCRAVIVMAHELGLKVVAEGVETPAQRDWLASVGCDYAQGYLFSRPVPADEFVARVRALCDAANAVVVAG